MTQHLMITLNSLGTAVVCLPIADLWGILDALPRGLTALQYHYQDGQAQISFPGLSLATAQRILDAAMQDAAKPKSDIFLRPRRMQRQA